MWGILALVLGLLPLDQLRLLGVAPVLYLMFFVKPIEQRPRPVRRNACSRCASPHSVGQNFCTKCGWDLSKEYTPEGGDTVLASEMHQAQSSSAATMERPAEAPADTPPGRGHNEPAASVEQAAETTGQPQPATEMASQEVATEHAEEIEAPVPDDPVPEPEAEPAEAARPWGIPQPGPAPTAEVMTARGAALLSEGRLQEAIDQFTKAIALDPKHREAFERRAEAYTKQGRGERAEEDYRQIQALNAGS